ncbi:hypothetical protein CCO03_01270 [Comamonas serinivorans]|uniref:Uncharacterized protein n=1 Tax=Comamonas serinivorans TaxID=1082851 RepID=A0A1Y0EIP3_9BURK|nr:hypothetical protein CCO03_01270 [Comamonas serinivorans]
MRRWRGAGRAAGTASPAAARGERASCLAARPGAVLAVAWIARVALATSALAAWAARVLAASGALAVPVPVPVPVSASIAAAWRVLRVDGVEAVLVRTRGDGLLPSPAAAEGVRGGRVRVVDAEVLMRGTAG